MVGILGAVVGGADKGRTSAITEPISGHHRRQLRLEAIEGRALLVADAIRAGEGGETHQDVGHRPQPQPAPLAVAQITPAVVGTGDQPLTVVGVNLAVLHGHGKFSGKGLDFQVGDAVGEMAQGASKQQSVLLLFAANAAKDMQHQNPVARLPFGQEFGRLGPAAADQHRRGAARQQLLPGLPLGIAPALPGGGQDALGGEADHAARHQGLDHKVPLAIGHAADIPTVVVGPAALDCRGGGRQLAPAQGHRGR